MNDNQPLNSTHTFSVLKKIILYLNVSSFRANERTTPSSIFSRNYHIRSASIGLLILIEYATAKYILHLPGIYFLRIAFFGLIYHTLIDTVFIKDIIIMAGNYNAYYNRYLFYLFLIFTLIGLIGGLITLNNEIGHVI